jgi:hypothetical protein
MRVKLVFDDWRDAATGRSVYTSMEGVALSMGDFHSGTVFDAEIELDSEQEQDLRASLAQGYRPVFWLGL